MNIVDMRGKLRSKGSYRDFGAASKTHIIVHHSLTKTGSAEAYARYHVDTLGWPGIGYHFVIEQDGTIKQNHSIGVMSYHVGNHNKYCVGICLTGDFRTQEPTTAQKNSLRQLVSYLQRNYPQLKTVKGHSDLRGYEWKECPCFDYAAVLREGNSNSNNKSKSQGVNIKVNKFNKVVTYEFGTALVPEMLGMMDALGYESRIISYGDKQGLVRFETAYRQGNELDRATAWLDVRGLKYYYTKE